VAGDRPNGVRSAAFSAADHAEFANCAGSASVSLGETSAVRQLPGIAVAFRR
jgi:hypothetical protein